MAETQTEQQSLLEQIVTEGHMAREDYQRPYARDLIGEFVKNVLEEEVTVSKDTAAMIQQRIVQIDQLISAQLNEVMHHPDFQALEGSWRGLNYLVMNTETSTRLKLRVLNVTKTELGNDLEKAVDFDQSALFKKLYEEEYGTFGGTPYSVLIGDYYFTRHP